MVSPSLFRYLRGCSSIFPAHSPVLEDSPEFLPVKREMPVFYPFDNLTVTSLARHVNPPSPQRAPGSAAVRFRGEESDQAKRQPTIKPH